MMAKHLTDFRFLTKRKQIYQAAGRRTPFIWKRGCDKIFVTASKSPAVFADLQGTLLIVRIFLAESPIQVVLFS